jgi:integrase
MNVCSLVAKHGGIKEAQFQAGHADIGTTADTYTHVDSEQAIGIANLLEDQLAAHLLPIVATSQLTD